MKTGNLISRILIAACLAGALFAMGCKTNPPSSVEDEKIDDDQDNDGGEDIGVLTIWISAMDWNPLDFYIDDEFVGTASPRRDGPQCGQEVTGVVTVELEEGTHEIYVAIGEDRTEAVEFDVEADKCELWELDGAGPENRTPRAPWGIRLLTRRLEAELR